MALNSAIASLIPRRHVEERQSFSLGFQQWMEMFQFNGNNYPTTSYQTLTMGTQEIGGLPHGAADQHPKLDGQKTTHRGSITTLFLARFMTSWKSAS